MTSWPHTGLVAAAVAAVTVVGWLAEQPRPSQEALVEQATRAAASPVVVRSVHIADADPEYATASIEGWDSSGAPIGTATAVLHRELGVWHVIDLGTAELGCRVPSAEVRAELDLFCPGS